MISDILRRLTQPSPSAPMGADDTRLALAALLVRVARTDGHYSATERDRIGRILARRYGLGPFAIAPILTEAEALEEQATDTVRFTRMIKDGVPYEERAAVIEALWEIVLADGERSQDENTFMRLVANLLGITDQDSALARQRIAARDR